MIKSLGLILIIVSSTVIGYFYGEGFRKRAKELSELQRGIVILRNEINFGHALLPEALMKVSEKCTGSIAKVFSYSSHMLIKNEEYDVHRSFIKAFEVNKDNLSLTKDDITIFLDLCRTLGEMDIEGHNDMFSLVTENLNKALQSAEHNLDKNIKMYRYLGFSFGAMVAIVLL